MATDLITRLREHDGLHPCNCHNEAADIIVTLRGELDAAEQHVKILNEQIEVERRMRVAAQAVSDDTARERDALAAALLDIADGLIPQDEREQAVVDVARRALLSSPGAEGGQ